MCNILCYETHFKTLVALFLAEVTFGFLNIKKMNEQRRWWFSMLRGQTVRTHHRLSPPDHTVFTVLQIAAS